MNDDNNDIVFSQDALINRALFLSDTNKINIFVEDTNKEYIYETIVDRLFYNNKILSNIFPTGGKQGLIKSFNFYGSHKDSIPNLYIADGDFDLLLGKKMIKSPSFIYLKCYNIEYYYLDKNAIIQFMKTKTKQVKQKTASIIDYDNWHSKIYNQFSELFILYMIIQHCYPSEKNVALPPNLYLLNDGFVDNSKVNQYKVKVSALVSNWKNEFLWCTNQIHKIYNDDFSKVICGKYILTSLHRYLIHISGINIKYDDFVNYLIATFDLKPLLFIKTKIEKLISGEL